MCIFIKTFVFADATYFEWESYSTFRSIKDVYNFGFVLTEHVLKDQQVQNLFKSNIKFDLVICEQFLNEAHYGFATYFDSALISFSSLGLSEWNYFLTSNPLPISYVPNNFIGYTTRMTFSQRFHNFFVYIFDRIYRDFVVHPKQEELLQKYFPKKLQLKEVMEKVSLVFLNSHPSVTIPVALAPSMVEIGGFHIKTKKLPNDLQQFLDGAEEGAILFSLGSNLRTSDLTQDKLNVFLEVFRKIKQKVLWKYEGDFSKFNLSNVYFSKWFPQRELLSHRNVRGFITHGGLLSTTEAVYFGVPFIGIPIFGDQKNNIALSVENGIAVKIAFSEISEKKLSRALNEILNNKMYKENVLMRSQFLKNRPIEPRKLITYWVDVILKNKNANFLKIAAANLAWYEYYLIDVFISILFIIFCNFILVCIIFNCFKTRRKQKIN